MKNFDERQIIERGRAYRNALKAIAACFLLITIFDTELFYESIYTAILSPIHSFFIVLFVSSAVFLITAIKREALLPNAQNEWKLIVITGVIAAVCTAVFLYEVIALNLSLLSDEGNILTNNTVWLVAAICSLAVIAVWLYYKRRAKWVAALPEDNQRYFSYAYTDETAENIDERQRLIMSKAMRNAYFAIIGMNFVQAAFYVIWDILFEQTYGALPYIAGIEALSSSMGLGFHTFILTIILYDAIEWIYSPKTFEIVKTMFASNLITVLIYIIFAGKTEFSLGAMFWLVSAFSIFVTIIYFVKYKKRKNAESEDEGQEKKVPSKRFKAILIAINAAIILLTLFSFVGLMQSSPYKYDNIEQALEENFSDYEICDSVYYGNEIAAVFMRYASEYENGEIYEITTTKFVICKDGKWSDPVDSCVDWRKTTNKCENNYWEEVLVHYIDGTDYEFISIQTGSNTYIDKDGSEQTKYADSINSEFRILEIDANWKECYTFADVNAEGYRFYVNGEPVKPFVEDPFDNEIEEYYLDVLY